MLKVYNIRIIKADSSELIRFDNKLIKKDSLELFRSSNKKKYNAKEILINYRDYDTVSN